MKELGARLGLTASQIYKWHWDRSQTVNKRFQKTLSKIRNVSQIAELPLQIAVTAKARTDVGQAPLIQKRTSKMSKKLSKLCLIFKVEKMVR